MNHPLLFPFVFLLSCSVGVSIKIHIDDISSLPIKLISLQDDLILQTVPNLYTVLQLNLCEKRDNTTCVGQKTICTLPQSATVVFACSCFPQAGLYTINSLNQSLLIDGKVWLDVKWPNFGIIIPTKHIVFDGAFTVKIKQPSTRSKVCIKDQSKITLRLKIVRLYTGYSAFLKPSDEYYSIPVASLSTEEVVIGCDVIERAGEYSFQLVINIDNVEYVMSTSEQSLQVEWDTRYQVQTPQDPVFPCVGDGHYVGFWRPKCSLDTDRIRLYAIEMVPGATVTSPTQLTYILERRIHPKTTTVRFGCSSFDLIYRGYCFKYVSVLRDGLVIDHNTQCLPTLQDIKSTDGSWSSWQDWSTCSTTCDLGLQVRLRFCDNPAPLHGGSFCDGVGVQRKQCHPQPCQNESNSGDGAESRCDCGCTVKGLNRRGIVVMYSKLCPNTSVWTVVANSYDVIRFSIKSYHLLRNDHLQIRDGFSNEYSLLLFDSNLSPRQTNKLLPNSFISSGNIVHISFTTSDSAKDHEETHGEEEVWNGAVLRYNFIDKRSLLPPPFYLELSFWMWILGGLFTAVLFLFLCYYLLVRTKQHLHIKCQRLLSAESSMHSSQCESTRCKLRSPAAAEENKRSIGIGNMSPKSHKREALLNPNNKTLEFIAEHPDDMITSVNTQSTRLSAISNDKCSPPGQANRTNGFPSRYVSRRSIGIQLSSPALTQKRGTLGSLVSVGTSSRNGASSPPISLSGTENDFEYDYYEAHVPGSFLSPLWSVPMQSDIDIDDIIGDSQLMLTPNTKTPFQSNSTQISPAEFRPFPISQNETYKFKF